ncbi:MAG TPA: oxygen-independent coproporphyrinogen III oxidase [Burkholderiaceae bacterium]|nr:oxygen-independent coproporphyrinogen III oxidase [Burkholderiaceae bacterium]
MMISVAEPRPELIARFDVAGPRYTSYPTADRFVEAFDAASLDHWLAQRANSPWSPPLSIYAHIPFCASVCYYCACNKIVTRDRSRALSYVQTLRREISLYRDRLGRREPYGHLHLGGGTPTFVDDDSLAALLAAVDQAFAPTPQAERSIEIDPRSVDPQRLRRLAAMGFDRVSFGVQDFDPQVQRAVHRVQPTETVFELTRVAREVGIASVNVDLIYGLPRQTMASFARTLRTLVELRPDRIALYGYAHLPERFKPQRRIDPSELPAASDKVGMMRLAVSTLTESGYRYIGLDHFALPTDALAIAQRRGVLNRNFMGYTTHPDADIVGLGVSAIGRIGACYSQNHRGIDDWRDNIDAGTLPVARGCELSRDDMIRRAVIMAIMCHGEVSFDALHASFLIEPRLLLHDEIGRLKEMQALGLVVIDDDSIRVTDQGRFFLRPIAMVFDRYLRDTLQRGKFSRVL